MAELVDHPYLQAAFRMKTRLLLLVGLALCALSVLGQSTSEPLPVELTLSTGRYPEAIASDTLHRIGQFGYSTVTGKAYRFAVQGQDEDDEIYGARGTHYCFEHRMHDPRVGRFLSIDPLAAKYPFYSPYAFSGNRVIDAVELEGLEPDVQNVPGRPGAVTANPVSVYSDPGLAEGDFGAVDGALCNYHCGIVDADGSITGDGWYRTDDYVNFAFSPNLIGPWRGGFAPTYGVADHKGFRELPFDPYSGIDPNSGRNQELFDHVLGQQVFFPGQPQGITPVYPERDILMIGRLLLSAPTAAEVDAIGAKAPVGRSGNPMDVAPYNTPTVINGRAYSGHALDQMQGRGLVPSVVENTIRVGVPYATRAGTSGFYDAVNSLRVIINTSTGRVVTTIPGAP
jgi:RHS repeat-associated protein